MGIKAIITFAFLAAAFVLPTACATAPSERVIEAEKEVATEVVVEKELLYDNGKNFLIVNRKDYGAAVVILQQWVDKHPEKHIVSIAADSLGSDGSKTIWLVYYEDAKKGE